LFDTTQLLSDSSGSGNNWACGACFYGPKYDEALMESMRRAAEPCDSLQSFLMLHSLGGGTGSGVGSYVLSRLEDEYPAVFRFAASIFPSADDDVVTSPYNSLLAADALAQHADVVLPMDNAALGDVCAATASRLAKQSGSRARNAGGTPITGALAADSKPFDAMNGVAANAVLQLTSSVRFPGPLNTDLNEIATNLVPFPRMHFLLSSMAPLVPPTDVPASSRAAGGSSSGGGAASACVPARVVDSLFGDALTKDTQLMAVDVKRSTCLAAALLLRGNVALSDVRRNSARMQSALRMAWWNSEGFKIGMCSAPPPGMPCSLFTLANTCGVGTTFTAMHQRFAKLRQRSFYLHHYSEYMSVEDMDDAAYRIAALADEYAQLDSRAAAPESVVVERFSSMGLQR